MKFGLRLCLLLLAAGGYLCAQSFPTPIQHVIIIVQENRTPDDLFQDQKLINAGADIALSPANQGGVPLGSCWDIGHSHDSWNNDYANQQKGQGFCETGHGKGTCQPFTCASDTYVSDSAIQPYWKMAESYGFANYMFQSNEGPSFPAHQFLFGGSSAPAPFNLPFYDHFASENVLNPGNSQGAGCIATSGQQAKDIDSTGEEDVDYTYNGMLGYPCYDHGTLTDLIKTANLSWKWYGFTDPASIWNAPNAISHVCMSSGPGGTCQGWGNNVDLQDTDIFSDIPSCKLANVSWVIPDGHYSDHPGGLQEGGPDWVANIVDAVANSNGACDGGKGYWKDTAILITWDDWGGFYDHVPPFEQLINCSTFGCGYVAGFRVPLIVVSAYTPTGYISGRCLLSSHGEVCSNDKPPYQHDVGSILNFTEYVMGLSQGGISKHCLPNHTWCFDDYWAPDYCGNPANNCDPNKYPYSLSDFFNFGAGPNAPTLIPTVTYHSQQDFITLVGGQPEEPDDETP